jgi:beta-glucanase (GH16 family)
VDRYACAAGEIYSASSYGYGCFTADMQPAKTAGVVTSFFAFSPPGNGGRLHNELSFQFRGTETSTVHLSVWTNGRLAGTRELKLAFDAAAAPHSYGFDWSGNGVVFLVDGRVMWERDNQWQGVASSLGGVKAPSEHIGTPDGSHTAMRIMVNVWAVDESASHVAGEFHGAAATAFVHHASYQAQQCPRQIV